jgi:hypothetical protein
MNKPESVIMELRFAAARAAEEIEESAICLDPRTDIFLYAGDAWYLHGARGTPESTFKGLDRVKRILLMANKEKVLRLKIRVLNILFM